VAADVGEETGEAPTSAAAITFVAAVLENVTSAPEAVACDTIPLTVFEDASTALEGVVMAASPPRCWRAGAIAPLPSEPMGTPMLRASQHDWRSCLKS
jgi:hypothetical protein